MASIRCFIAIEMAADMLHSLSSLQDWLSDRVPANAVRWVVPGNVHLTLKFLGDVSPADVDRIGKVMQSVASDSKPFALRLDKLGCFPNPRKPRVIWLGIEGDVDPLIRLQRALEQGLERQGWSSEGRRFHPHLTLGRVKNTSNVVEAGYPWGQIRAAGHQQVSEICLVESDLRPSGAIYTVRMRTSLGVARSDVA